MVTWFLWNICESFISLRAVFIKRVSALFLTIIYTDLNSNVNPEKESISFDVKNVELYKKKEYTFLKFRWEKWGTYLSKILICSNKSSPEKIVNLRVCRNFYADYICLFYVYCLLCRTCKRHHTYDVKNAFLGYWVPIWCETVNS